MNEQRARRRHPRRQRRGAVALQRVARAHQPPQPVKPEAAQRLAADMDMSLMGRIEGAAQKADHLTGTREGQAVGHALSLAARHAV